VLVNSNNLDPVHTQKELSIDFFKVVGTVEGERVTCRFIVLGDFQVFAMSLERIVVGGGDWKHDFYVPKEIRTNVAQRWSSRPKSSQLTSSEAIQLPQF